jgi:NAD(P)H-dependent FMN reductase
MLREIDRGMAASGAPTRWLDLRDYDLPHWDGREGSYGAPDLDRLRAELERCTAFVVSVPAYWNAASGVVLNMIDLVGGEPFAGKLAGLLVVGMDVPSAWHGAAQMRAVLQSLGAWCPPEQVVVGNPREHTDVAGLRQELRRYGAYLGLLVTGRARPYETLAGAGEEVEDDGDAAAAR